jgi:hypothetical protein
MHFELWQDTQGTDKIVSGACPSCALSCIFLKQAVPGIGLNELWNPYLLVKSLRLSVMLFILLSCNLKTKTMTFNVSDSVSPGPRVIYITV